MIITKPVLIGIIILNGKVDITDPCYDCDTWCRINNVGVISGIYNCYATVAEWGGKYPERRITDCQIIHKDYDGNLYEWERIGAIGVDAGLAGFFQSPKKDYSFEEWSDFCEWVFSKDSHNPTNAENDMCYIHDGGFFTQSGFGDGGYDVYAAKDESGNILGLEIIFIEEDDLEEVK